MHLSPGGRADRKRLADVLSGLLVELPFLQRGVRTTWQATSGRCALAAATHPPEQVGGVGYIALRRDRVAAFSGRPFLWTDEFEADGRAALDPELYLRPAGEWIDRIDGRWAAVRYDDEQGELEVCSDLLGSYPVYYGGRGELYCSNSPELVRRLVDEGRSVSRSSVLASFFACGASIDGVPRWESVERLPPGVQRFAAADAVRRGADRIDWPSFLDDRFDAEVASRRLVAVVRALADWPGRPAFVSLSGGRDSRVVFAAALAGEVDVRPRTMAIPGVAGYPETRDVRLARQLCARAGVAHDVIEPLVRFGPSDAAALLGLMSPGAISLELALQGALAQRPVDNGPMEIVLTGHCGEVARAYYGVVDDDAVAQRLVARTMPSIPRPLLSRSGKELYRRLVTDWIGRERDVGIDGSTLLDLFYLDQRMPHWIAVSQGVSEYVHDLTNPFWSRRLISQEVGFAPEQRRQELFHLELLRVLAPTLLELPFDVEAFGRGSRRDGGMSAGRARTVAKVLRELRRSLRGSPGPDLLPDAVELLRREVATNDMRAAWEILDRRRVLRLLAMSPRRLDRRSRSLIWRLATVLLADEHARPPHAAFPVEAIAS